MKEQQEDQNIKVLMDFFNATKNSEDIRIDDVYIREAIIYCVNKSIQKGEPFENIRRQMARIKLNINKAFKAVSEFDEKMFEMDFIPLAKASDRISDLRVESMVEEFTAKSKEERLEDLVKEFYGEDLSQIPDNSEVLEGNTHSNIVHEESILPKNDAYLTVKEVALRLKMSQQGVRKHIKVGNLYAERLGKLYRIKESDLLKFLGR